MVAGSEIGAPGLQIVWPYRPCVTLRVSTERSDRVANLPNLDIIAISYSPGDQIGVADIIVSKASRT